MILSCRNLDVAYGQAQVLFGVDLDIDDGEIVALLGINGAGKSTLLRAITGLLPPIGGTIVFDGVDITGAGPERIARSAISMVPGGRGVFPGLSVDENLRIAGWLLRRDRERFARRRDAVMELFPILADRHAQLAGNLSGGEQQMLTIAQALLSEPRLLLIDELSLGLAPVVVAQLMDTVRAIHDRGTTIVIVEQSLNVALELCERAVFMEKGEVRFDGPAADLRDRPDLVRSVFLGGALPAPGPPPRGVTVAPPTPSSPAPHPDSRAAAEMLPRPLTRRKRSFRPGDPVRVPPTTLEVRDISVRFGGIKALDDVNLRVHSGEITGIIGANGAGKTTLFDIISGFLRPDEGRVLLNGVNVTRWSPSSRSWAGLGRSFQDALLFSSLTARETIAVALERTVEVREPVSLALGFPIARASERNVRTRVDELVDQCGIGPHADKLLSELSTGTRRMVDIACCLAHRPSVLLLDEPAAGIAQRETEALAPLIRSIRDTTGVSLLIIEHDMPLIRSVCEQVIVLDAGSVIATGTPRRIMEDPAVLSAYLGGNAAAIERSDAETPV